MRTNCERLEASVGSDGLPSRERVRVGALLLFFLGGGEVACEWVLILEGWRHGKLLLFTAG